MMLYVFCVAKVLYNFKVCVLPERQPHRAVRTTAARNQYYKKFSSCKIASVYIYREVALTPQLIIANITDDINNSNKQLHYFLIVLVHYSV